MRSSVIIEKYDPKWVAEYEIEAGKIKALIGENIMGIEHIGSTSVTGLEAKPIIDIMAGVNDLVITDTFIEPLERIRYEFVNHKEFFFRRFFRKGQRGAGTHHLHIYQYQGEEWNHQLLFRDYLRNNPDVRNQYDRLKRGLADSCMDRLHYTSAKAPFIKKVMDKAKF
ncbi:GrpB family protein [Bacillus massiliglaciei]|uniref:GrpB family protein n=1 Tax=Bacillus massiliglaciei TaxID=1816693 RepID=UPI000ACE6F26|nr:GrpB family protein [Bacillus massiliglaciei]